MKTKITLRILLLLLISMPSVAFSQYTYLDISMGNRFMTLAENKDMNYRTRYNQTNIQVNGVWRIVRNFGVGMTASFPVRQGGKYYMNTVDNNIFNAGSFASISEFDYHFEESAKVAFNGRVYGGIKGSFYIDARISIFSFSEHLKIDVSSYEYVTAVNTVEKNKFKQLAPGFSIGMNPHLSEKIFMNLNLGWDFYKFDGVGFKNAGESETYTVKKYHEISFKSQLPEKRYAFSVNFGLGYFF